MLIAGLQKLSLIDYPGTVAAVVFTQGCHFRCAYCHNPDLISLQSPDEASAQREREVFAYLQEKKYFLEGVCVTGGEPTLHADLPEFLKQLKSIGLKVKLDTNGYDPNMIRQIIRDNIVDYFAMDIKHTWRDYDTVIRTGSKQMLANVQETFHVIQDSGVPHEFRTTVFPGTHTPKTFVEIASYLKPGEHYYMQNIRYGKTLDSHLDTGTRLDVTTIVKDLQARYPEVVIAERG